MEDRRFDDLARVFASGTSRRSLVKLLTGIVVGGVAADLSNSATKAVGVGENCATNADCDAFLLCVDLGNGTSICQENCQTGVDCSVSGDPNCCSRCCGGCDSSGACSASCSVDGHPCQPGGGHPYLFGCCSGNCNATTFVCEAEEPECLATGSTCSSGTECCSQACDPNGNTCCEGLGAACPGSDCCGTLTCEDGFCCAPAGNSCGSSNACCGNLVCNAGVCGDACLESDVSDPQCPASIECCDPNAIYNPNNCQCRVLCDTGISCFSDTHCPSDQWCNSGCCVPCLADGEGVYCATNQACCSGNCDMNNCGCRSIQTDCTLDEQCCSGICSDQEPRVCLPPSSGCVEIGGTCEATSDCCDDDPRYRVTCVEYECVACLLTNAVPGRCDSDTQPNIACCDHDAVWNQQSCTCEIPCVHMDGICSEDEDCCDDLQCVNGHCGKHPTCAGEKATCDAKMPCCKGYECVAGHCKKKQVPKPPKPPKPPRPPKPSKPVSSNTGTIDALPSTGTGPNAGGSGWSSTVAAGGAAALAAWGLRRSRNAGMQGETTREQ